MPRDGLSVHVDFELEHKVSDKTQKDEESEQYQHINPVHLKQEQHNTLTRKY